MTGLYMLYLLIGFGMIYGLGHWHWSECRRRRDFELDAWQDRREIRQVAEAAASDAAACAAVIDRINKPAKSRRHLRAVRDDKRG
ncbi:MAG: hypothetical protein WBA97_34270 [Actinophytocola sp.]|uniref:hypothetical protein n=1 Tax=Actinophytocola sp. TaxID=1872138 RepID=UPI003C76407E